MDNADHDWSLTMSRPPKCRALDFFLYIYKKYVIHGFHFLSFWSLSRAPTNSVPPPCTIYPLLPEQNCQPHSLTCLCRTPTFYMPLNQMETPALPFWPAGFRDHVCGTCQQRASRWKRGGGVRAPGSSTLTWMYLQALTWWNQQQERPRSVKAERGSRDSWFPTWILTSVSTAALREPFSAFVSLPLFGRERKFKNYCEKHRLCVTQRLEMQNNCFWQKTGLTLVL